MTEEKIISNAQNMAIKLSSCAEGASERFRAKRGEEVKLPGYIRLMYSAAKVITELYEYIQNQGQQLENAMSMLTEEASCNTCKNGEAKKCSIKSECGKDHSLWEFKF